jgi:hypothetical protein
MTSPAGRGLQIQQSVQLAGSRTPAVISQNLLWIKTSHRNAVVFSFLLSFALCPLPFALCPLPPPHPRLRRVLPSFTTPAVTSFI